VSRAHRLTLSFASIFDGTMEHTTLFAGNIPSEAKFPIHASSDIRRHEMAHVCSDLITLIAPHRCRVMPSDKELTCSENFLKPLCSSFHLRSGSLSQTDDLIRLPSLPARCAVSPSSLSYRIRSWVVVQTISDDIDCLFHRTTYARLVVMVASQIPCKTVLPADYG
jgi:hypothetical protein